MDSYPKQLAPEFEESGAVKTPFEEWWPPVKEHFSIVPENVACYWLHEHWGSLALCLSILGRLHIQVGRLAE